MSKCMLFLDVYQNEYAKWEFQLQDESAEECREIIGVQDVPGSPGDKRCPSYICQSWSTDDVATDYA